MNKTLLLMLGLVGLAVAMVRRQKPGRAGAFQQFSGWQKLVGWLAVVLAFLILLSPEFAALGLLGDASFFDLLVLALSAQILGYVQWAWRGLFIALKNGLRRIGIPSPGFRLVMAVSSFAIAGAVVSVQKVVHRILS